MATTGTNIIDWLSLMSMWFHSPEILSVLKLICDFRPFWFYSAKNLEWVVILRLRLMPILQAHWLSFKSAICRRGRWQRTKTFDWCRVRKSACFRDFLIDLATINLITVMICLSLYLQNAPEYKWICESGLCCKNMACIHEHHQLSLSFAWNWFKVNLS